MMTLPPGSAIAPELRQWAVTDVAGEPLDEGNEILRFLSASPDHAADVLQVHFERWLRSPLGPRLTELVRLAVAQQTGCPVCQSVRRPAAHREGVDEDLIYAVLRDPTSAGLTDRETLAVTYAGALAGDHSQIDDQTYEALRDHFTDTEIVELALIAASFLAQGRILETLTRGQVCPVQDVTGGSHV
ncbi:carboxymuconolactone decarboxylase family protein [Euzebya tangerina]|uniref:carboxymuconolactone decarboxylase family protein n=1 Tax=Euzebya tangerina TaxID=591198 RepID=UPI000E321587|nr:carboxymuconolactone decarboxylase family protein [Euzebya tangerina]